LTIITNRTYNPVVNVETWLHNVRESTRNDVSYVLGHTIKLVFGHF